MRSSLLLFGSILALAVACGGKTNYGPGEPGDGGSSSSSGAGGSSGASGSSSGGSSGSGSSSGSVTCTPLPGCSSSVECPAPGGCGSCICQEDTGWVCTDCIISDASPVDDSPYPVCPPSAPPDGAICQGVGASCFFPIDSGCGYEECDCDPSGTWGCYADGCIDAGPPTDAGIFDAGPCPIGEPGPNAPCPEDGLVCSYFNGCQANCLCTSTGWVCANEPPCK